MRSAVNRPAGFDAVSKQAVFPPRVESMLSSPLHVVLDSLIHLPSELCIWIISFLSPAQISLLSGSPNPGSWVGPWLPSGHFTCLCLGSMHGIGAESSHDRRQAWTGVFLLPGRGEASALLLLSSTSYVGRPVTVGVQMESGEPQDAETTGLLPDPAGQSVCLHPGLVWVELRLGPSSHWVASVWAAPVLEPHTVSAPLGRRARITFCVFTSFCSSQAAELPMWGSCT